MYSYVSCEYMYVAILRTLASVKLVLKDIPGYIWEILLARSLVSLSAAKRFAS